MNDLSLIMPEILLTGFVCLLLMVDVYRKPSSGDVTFWTAVVSVGIVIVSIITYWPAEKSTGFSETLIIDPMSILLKLVLLISLLFNFFYAREYFKRSAKGQSEFYILTIFSALGMMVLISAQSLLTLYLGLELLSLSLYAMVAMERDSALASEAAMKYFILGALASGMLLYGISMLYGVSGTLNLTELAEYSVKGDQSLLLVFGLVFVLVGISFKLGIAPFHMWVPDVYQGASTPVTLFISSAPKIAAFAMAVRVLVDGLPGLSIQWSAMLTILAVTSIAIGNIVAIAQTNIKRMLAYSTISHMGFLILGIIAATAQGYAASMFYVFIYAITSMSAFGIIILLVSKSNAPELISDFAGLAKTRPWISFISMVVIFSLAGVPPFAGFWAKWFVLKELIASGSVLVAAVAVIFSLIGAYYYLRVVKIMYFDEPGPDSHVSSQPSLGAYVFTLNGALILFLGLFPGVLMHYCLVAMQAY